MNERVEVSTRFTFFQAVQPGCGNQETRNCLCCSDLPGRAADTRLGLMPVCMTQDETRAYGKREAPTNVVTRIGQAY